MDAAATREVCLRRQPKSNGGFPIDRPEKWQEPPSDHCPGATRGAAEDGFVAPDTTPHDGRRRPGFVLPRHLPRDALIEFVVRRRLGLGRIGPSRYSAFPTAAGRDGCDAWR